MDHEICGVWVRTNYVVDNHGSTSIDILCVASMSICMCGMLLLENWILPRSNEDLRDEDGMDGRQKTIQTRELVLDGEILVQSIDIRTQIAT